MCNKVNDSFNQFDRSAKLSPDHQKIKQVALKKVDLLYPWTT